MKTNRIFAFAVAFALAFAVGCSLDDPFSADGPTAPPAPTVTTLAGTCRALTVTNQVVCEDNSTTQPAGRLRAITFHLRDNNGLLVETRTASPTSAPPRQVEFTGLNAGTYLVEHVVENSNGDRTSRTYLNLQVF